MMRIFHILRAWLPLAAAITGLSLLSFGFVQQDLRQGANDPQIQMAEDASAALDGGAAPPAVVPQPSVDIARSLAPFLLLYDAAGKPVAGSGLLGGTLPAYPLGALQAARPSGENRVTWQPQPSVRIASVVVPFRNGYVVAGRSLRETEQRVARMQTLTLLGWLATLGASLMGAAIVDFLPRTNA